MSQEEALRNKLSAMDTDALLSMWRHQERLPWAEEVLRTELVSRGISPCILEKAAATRHTRKQRHGL